MHRIHTEKLNKETKSQLWDEIVNDFLQSDINLKQYCEQNLLIYDHLSYYLARHRRKQELSDNKPHEFVPVQLTMATVNNNYLIKVDNIEVQLPAHCGITQIAALVAELRKKAC